MEEIEQIIVPTTTGKHVYVADCGISNVGIGIKGEWGLFFLKLLQMKRRLLWRKISSWCLGCQLIKVVQCQNSYQ